MNRRGSCISGLSGFINYQIIEEAHESDRSGSENDTKEEKKSVKAEAVEEQKVVQRRPLIKGDRSRVFKKTSLDETTFTMQTPATQQNYIPA